MKLESFYAHTLGCKVNAYETSSLTALLKEKGLKEDDSEQADLIILNTCSVTSTADQKSRQKISSYRKKNQKAIILVMGCYSQKKADICLSLGADIVLGASNRNKAYEYILSFKESGQKIKDVKPSLRKERYEELGQASLCEKERAYLKIQDGCDSFCSYCHIPLLRGNSRSREPREAVNEAIYLTSKGYKEIVITGIHIGKYGYDLGDGSFRLAALCKAILDKCPSLYRLRVSSLEESEIDDAFLALLKSEPRLASHLHIPLQSGSSKVLKDMKRPYDTEAFLSKLEAIREARPNIAITTDVIAGFPSEDETSWQETLEFCSKAKFAEIHVFPFSSRPSTLAATMKDLDPTIKKERVGQLLALSKRLRKEYEEAFYGKEVEILFEDYDSVKKVARGHTSNYLLLSIPSEVPLDGEIKNVIYDSSTASD